MFLFVEISTHRTLSMQEIMLSRRVESWKVYLVNCLFREQSYFHGLHLYSWCWELQISVLPIFVPFYHWDRRPKLFSFFIECWFVFKQTVCEHYKKHWSIWTVLWLYILVIPTNFFFLDCNVLAYNSFIIPSECIICWWWIFKNTILLWDRENWITGIPLHIWQGLFWLYEPSLLLWAKQGNQTKCPHLFVS